MKKIYLSPAIETMELRFSPMMTGELSGEDIQGNQQNPFFPAPGKKPF